MKATYTPAGGTEILLHDLGDIFILSQASTFTPEDLPQIETVSPHIRIDFWQQTFADNYDLVRQAKAALKRVNGVLKIQDENIVDDEGTVIAQGEIFLNQTVVIVSEDLPENPNSWGTYQQQINIVFKYEVNDIATVDTHLQATFRRTGGSATITLGNVMDWHEGFRNSRYSEMKDLRERSSGSVAIEGFFPGDPLQTPAARRIALNAKRAEMIAQCNDKSGTLTYGPAGNRFFDGLVKVDAFDAKVNQAVTRINFSMTVSYTKFPSESGYAAADVKVSVVTDNESGDIVMTLAGSIKAATEVIALAKLAAVRTAAMSSSGYTLSQRIDHKADTESINCDDGTAFMALTFSETFRKRAVSLESYNLVVSDTDDARTGFRQVNYSGSVVAGAATQLAAYAAALARAQAIGDNKHPLRLAGKTVANYRKVKDGAEEIVRLDFSYDYLVKGTRVYLELTSEASSDTFSEDSERVSGFVVAETLAAARSAYETIVKAPYAALVIRNEATSENKMRLGDEEMEDRLTFSFTVFRAKPTGFFAIKYGISVEVDLTALKSATTVKGRFTASALLLAAAEAGTAGNKLDVFLAGFDFGKLIRKTRDSDHEKVGDTSDDMTGIEFSNSWVDTVATANQIVRCELREEIQYSGTRWQFQPLPDGSSVPQNCGTEHGYRTISGSVVAATETAAMLWVKKQRTLTFPSGNGGGSAPGTRYVSPPRVSRGWEFLPIEDGTARGGSANAVFVEVSFQFSETLVDFPYVET